MAIRYIDEIQDLSGKKVFLRVDFNVPLDEAGNVTEDTRIRGAIPTIEYAVKAGARLVIASHLGRPKGERKPKYSMAPAAKRLGELLGKEIRLASDCIGADVTKMVDSLANGDILMLENVRFYAEEEKNDEKFAQALANGCEIYVNDAFGVSHRAHASVEAITRFFPVVAAGFLMKNEMTFFEKAMMKPERPLYAILGGAKVSGKLEALEALLEKVDGIIIGGGMAFTFLKAMGLQVGKSLVEDNLLDTAGNILKKAKERNIAFHLPVDCVVADRFDAAAESRVVSAREIPEDWMALDVGPASVEDFRKAIGNARTIIWNGPMGVFEMDAFAKGTFEIAEAVASSPATTILGGGDTDAAANKAGVADRVSYISTGGGAFLELLEGKKLPGVKVLEERGQ